jgi:superfamily II DNA or RNA helicase
MENLKKLDDLLTVLILENERREDIKYILNNYKFAKWMVDDPQKVKDRLDWIIGKIVTKEKFNKESNNEIIENVSSDFTEAFGKTEPEIYNLLEFIFNNYTFDICTSDEENIEENIEEYVEEYCEADLDLVHKFSSKPDWNGWRPNQQDVIDKLKKNGFITGIHCHATGTGKSFLILKHCQEFVDQNKKGDIIIITERVNILVDLFLVKNEDNTYVINQENKKMWKENDILDLDKFKFIEFVTKKNKGTNWVDIVNRENSKPKIIIVNRAFAVSKEKYKDIKNIGLVIHDECHSASSPTQYKFLSFFKKKSIPLIGFSATPIRQGKNNVSKLCEIYGDTSLNIITNYNMMYSISEGWILPPTFHWFYYLTNKKKNIPKEIENQEKTIMMTCLNSIVHKMPYKKGVAWCGKLIVCKSWLTYFNEHRHEYENLKNMNAYMDHSNQRHNDYGYDEEISYDKFRKVENNAILFCANKNREGSDIPALDWCIFLDKVKKRAPNVFIQSIGRVLRKLKDKKCGYIIDGYLKAEPNKQWLEICYKILEYYLSLDNLTCDSLTAYEKQQKFNELRTNTDLNSSKSEITILCKNEKIIIHTNELEWELIAQKFNTFLQKKMSLSSTQIWIDACKTLKEKFNFTDINLNFSL